MILKAHFQGCTKYRIQNDFLTEKDKLIKKQNTSRKQISQLQSNIETLTTNLQNIENEVKAKKPTENKTMKF